MKKMLTALLGLGFVLGSVSPAMAWSKVNFGAGFNWGWEGGGNSFLFGLVKGADVPWAQGGMPMGGGSHDSEMAQQMAAPGAGGHGQMPGAAADPNAIPRPMPNMMPRADAQPVGYFQQNQALRQQAPAQQYAAPSDYAAPSYWYDR